MTGFPLEAEGSGLCLYYLEGSQPSGPRSEPSATMLTVKAGRGPVYSAQATDLLREELWAGPGAWVSLSPPSAAF